MGERLISIEERNATLAGRGKRRQREIGTFIVCRMQGEGKGRGGGNRAFGRPYPPVRDPSSVSARACPRELSSCLGRAGGGVADVRLVKASRREVVRPILFLVSSRHRRLRPASIFTRRRAAGIAAAPLHRERLRASACATPSVRGHPRSAAGSFLAPR